AAEAMGVPPERVFKTLVADVDGALTVAVVPVAGQLDLKALASAVGGKRAAMADPALAERTTGYVRGGISPLGQRKKLPTVLAAGQALSAAPAFEDEAGPAFSARPASGLSARPASGLSARPAFEDEAVQADRGSRGRSPLAGPKGQRPWDGTGRGGGGEKPQQ